MVKFFAFLLATIATFFISALAPQLHLTYFAPFLALAMSESLPSLLWGGAASGFICDLVSSSHFGLNTLSYTITAFLLFKAKRFSNDTLLNLSLFTALIAIVFSLIYIATSFILGNSLELSFKGFFTDLIIMPLLDALFAFLWFFCPIKAFNAIKRSIKYKLERGSN